MSSRLLETYLGAVVLITAGLFLWFALPFQSAENSSDAYPLWIRYANVGGLAIGAPVRMAGVRIGKVSDITIDEKTYEARVKIFIDNYIKVPKDSIAQITIGSLLGSSEIRLRPGKSDINLAENEEIPLSLDAVSLEDAIGNIIYDSSQ